MVEELETRFYNLKNSIGIKSKETLDVMVSLANFYVTTKEYDLAENLLREAYIIDLELCGEYNRDTIYTIDSLGRLFLHKKDYLEAKKYFDISYSYKLKTYNKEEIENAKQEKAEFNKLISEGGNDVF